MDLPTQMLPDQDPEPPRPIHNFPVARRPSRSLPTSRVLITNPLSFLETLVLYRTRSAGLPIQCATHYGARPIQHYVSSRLGNLSDYPTDQELRVLMVQRNVLVRSKTQVAQFCQTAVLPIGSSNSCITTKKSPPQIVAR